MEMCFANTLNDEFAREVCFDSGFGSQMHLEEEEESLPDVLIQENSTLDRGFAFQLPRNVKDIASSSNMADDVLLQEHSSDTSFTRSQLPRNVQDIASSSNTWPKGVQIPSRGIFPFKRKRERGGSPPTKFAFASPKAKEKQD